MARVASSPGLYRALLILGGIVLLTAALYWAQKVLIPLALAVLLTFILGPLVAGLQRWGLGRIPSVLLVVVLSFLLLGGIGSALTLQVKKLANELPQYKGNMAQKIAGLREVGQGTFLEDLQDLFKELTTEHLNEDAARRGANPEPVPVRLQASGVSSLEGAVGPAVEILASAGLVVVLVVFMLIQREDLRNRLVRLVGHGRLISTTRAFDEAARRLSRYLLMQLIVNAGFGVVLGLGLFVIGVPYVLLWAILAAALRFLPYVGSTLTIALLAIFSVAVFPGWTQPLLVVGMLVVLEIATANIVEPLLFGHSTGVSPVALLIAAAFWTWLWGPLGLVLSTPMTACLVVLGRYVPHLEFLGVLLGDEPVLDTEVRYYQRLLARDQDEATDLVEEFLQDHPLETVYDTVLAPALVLTKRDRESGELSADDEQFILQATRAILDDLVPSPCLGGADREASSPTEGLPLARPKVVAFGCPARDEADELALHMFRQMLEGTACQLEVISADTLTAEVVSCVQLEQPALVCIAGLPPGGLAQTRYLCKRLRAQFPELKIIVGRWGLPEANDRVRERLVSSGADQVVTTLLDARAQVIPLIQVFAHVQETQTAAPTA